jgi:hypothetical protein
MKNPKLHIVCQLKQLMRQTVLSDTSEHRSPEEERFAIRYR